MTKNELMEMAREFCVSATPGRKNFYDADLIKFANAILERAAVELSTYGVIQDMGGADSAEIVRSLKLPTN